MITANPAQQARRDGERIALQEVPSRYVSVEFAVPRTALNRRVMSAFRPIRAQMTNDDYCKLIALVFGGLHLVAVADVDPLAHDGMAPVRIAAASRFARAPTWRAQSLCSIPAAAAT